MYAHVLDFFGGMFEIRNGAAVVPGSAKSWAGLTGVSPSNPGAFFEKLMATRTTAGWPVISTRFRVSTGLRRPI